MSKIRSGITQATASAEGVISVEGNIGKNKTQGSIDSEGIWDIGIDFKVGGLGITNDYGGAITVSIAGQSITWGREGGMIHYALGGFEVIVEARDCVVTETKKIMGIVVAAHTYPDPGCELPPPPDIPVLPSIPDAGASKEIPDTDELIWIVIGETLSQRHIDSSSGYYTYTLIADASSNSQISNIPEIVKSPSTGTSIPFLVINNSKGTETENYIYPSSPQSDIYQFIDLKDIYDSSTATLGRVFYTPSGGGTSEIYWATTMGASHFGEYAKKGLK